MSINIIELSQNRADKVFSNGDYRYKLKKELIMEEGDSLNLKACFLDTINISGNEINIDQDLTLNFNVGYYLNNWQTNSENGDKTIETGGTQEATVDGEDYVACTIQDRGGPAPPNLAQVTEIKFRWDSRYNPSNFYWGLNKTAIFQYEDAAGNTQQFSCTIPKIEFDDHENFYSFKNLNIVIRFPAGGNISDYFVLTNEEYMKEKAAAEVYAIYTNPVNNSNYIAVPYTTKYNIDLPANSYSPDELAQYLSTQLSQNIPTSASTSIVNSPFLKTTKANGKTFTSDLPEVIFCKPSTGNIIFYFNSSKVSNNYYVGTSQIQFNYNSDFNKFEIDFLNMPFYDNSEIAVSYRNLVDYQGNTQPEFFVSRKNGGIFFTNLSAVIKGTTQSYDFWNGKMGFDLNKLLVNITHDITGVKSFPRIGTGSTIIMPLISLTDGINITGAYSGLDSVVQKTSDFNRMPSGSLTSSSSNQISITSDALVSNSIQTDSHYLIEVSGNFKNSYISNSQVFDKIISIVSKYYGYGSYTSSGEDNIIYVHKGEPVMLTDFKIRVLSPLTYDVAEDLQENNTVYLQLTKNN